MNKYEVNIYEQIAKNIKKYRKEAGITQAVLAEKVGVSHEFIRRNESKKGKKSFSVDKNFLRGSFVDENYNVVCYDDSLEQLTEMINARSKVMLDVYSQRWKNE